MAFIIAGDKVRLGKDYRCLKLSPESRLRMVIVFFRSMRPLSISRSTLTKTVGTSSSGNQHNGTRAAEGVSQKTGRSKSPHHSVNLPLARKVDYLEWRTIPFPGRIRPMGLVSHASVENAQYAFQAEELR